MRLRRVLSILKRTTIALIVIAIGLAVARPARTDREPPVPLPPPVTTVAPRTAVADVRLAGLPRGPVVGMADNRPETLLDPRFQRTGIKRIRVIVPYDDILQLKRRGYLDGWFAVARARGIEPLVSFYRSYRSLRRLPSVRTYKRIFRLFRRRYPWVRYFVTWDEANFAAAQPTGRSPARAAQFYRTARRECSRGRCTVVTADFRAEGSRHSRWWLREFKRRIGRGPHIWGLVAHPDVTRRTSRYTREFLRSTRGPVWVTEVGAVHFFGRGLRPSIRRQTSSMRYLLTRFPRVSRRFKRIYYYHWRAARGNRLWDSALLSVSGRRRPAYYLFFRALGRRAA